MKYKIAVGTSSPKKIEYLHQAIKALGLQANLFPHQVKSMISDQPLTSKETKTGSINRAKNALKVSPEADFSIGIEIGYRQNPQNKFFILCWSTIIDTANYCVSCRSHSFLLPKFHQKIINQNKELSNHVRSYLNIKTNPVTQIVGIDIRDRKPYISNSLRQVLLRYLSRNEF